MPHGSVDTNSDPEVQVPQKISPTSSNNLEVVFHKLGEIIEKSMERQSVKESNYGESQKKKAWKELDSSIKDCVLNASSSMGVCPAEALEDSLLTIMTKKSPAKISTHLYFVLNRRNIVIYKVWQRH